MSKTDFHKTGEKAEEERFFKLIILCEFVFHESAVTMGDPSTRSSVSHMTCFVSTQRKISFATLEQKSYSTQFYYQ